MAKKLFTIITFYPVEDQRQPCKYRNVASLENFAKFARKCGFAYGNVYDKETRAYLSREYYKQ